MAAKWFGMAFNVVGMVDSNARFDSIRFDSWILLLLLKGRKLGTFV